MILLEFGSATIESATLTIHGQGETRAGARLLSGNPMIGKKLKKCAFRLSKTGSPTGTAYVEVYEGDTLRATMGSIDVSTLTLSTVEYSFENDDNDYVMKLNDAITVRYESGESLTQVNVAYDGHNNDDIGVARLQNNGSWLYGTYDPWIKMWAAITVFVEANLLSTSVNANLLKASVSANLLNRECEARIL